MHFLFSGEGATDLGLCADRAATCQGAEYHHGPFTTIVDRMVEASLSRRGAETRHGNFIANETVFRRTCQPAPT